jgi:hypothetical protein
MTYRLQNLMLAMLLAMTTLFVGFGTLSQNPTSGGYQLFERVASGISADIQLASLDKFSPSPETAAAYANAPNTGRITGNPAKTTSSDPEAIRGIARDNDAAQSLANNGFDVVQNPGTLPNGKTPDLRLNGEIYDVVSPSSNRVRNIGSRIEGKVESGQTQNVVVNLSDTTVTPSQLTQQLRDYPVSGLQSVVIIDRSGSVLPPVRFD